MQGTVTDLANRARGNLKPGRAILEMSGLRLDACSADVWTPIVHGINLTVHRGEVLGLIGESGAGKSTIGLAALGYARDGCRISGGSIVFDGTDLNECTGKQLRNLRGKRIAYVAQSAAAAFNPAHRIIDQCIEVPVHIVGQDRPQAIKDIKRIFGLLQLPDPESIGDRYPHQLSGGQLQRAMVAMAMAGHPDLIVFDEPTTALDVTTQIEVMASIRNAVEHAGTAAIYVSHDLAVVAQMAHRVMVLRHGEVVEEGDVEAILHNPCREYTKQLVSARQTAPAHRPVNTDDEVIISVQDIRASYGQSPVLNGINFEIPRQRTVAVVGESGSGKSTVARVITGLLPPDHGVIRYGGEMLPTFYGKRTKDELRQIQMVYQMPDTALNPKHSVRDVIGRPLEFYLGIEKVQRETRIRELLSLIELDPDEFIDRTATELSGGQKQRICIARALAAEPSVIICDEVTSALDQLVGEEIIRLLNDLQNRLGLSYLFISHDLATVRAVADYVLVMRRGDIVDFGSTDAIFNPPYHEYTELLLSSVPEMRKGWLDELLQARNNKDTTEFRRQVATT